MLPITYYFWNSYKKSWYVRGKLDRSEYDKRVSQWWKDSNVFVKKLVDSVLEDQAKTVKDAITTLEIESNKADKELSRVQSLKAEEERKTSEMFANKKIILEQEKAQIDQDFEDNSLLDAQQLKWAKEILWNLLEKLWEYSEQVKWWVKDQAERLLSQWKSALKRNTKLTAQEIKDNIIPKEKNNNPSTNKWSNKLWSSLWYLIFLILMCIFDIILWYWVALDIFTVYEWNTLINPKWAALFVALFVIPLAIWLIHFSVRGMWWWENKNMNKQLWLISVLFVIFIVALYIFQSSPQLLKSVMWNELWNALAKKPEILFRSFLLPSLFAWEIIIWLINRDLILDYFWIWKKKWPNSLSKLITNWLYFLKSKRISSYAKEEKMALENLVNEMQSEEVPAFTEIKKDISEIQSILDPIRNKQSQKVEEYNEKITNIKNKMDKNLKDFNDNMQWIANKYANEITRFENIKKINEIKINKLNHDLNQHSIEVKQWILIWLIDK